RDAKSLGDDFDVPQGQVALPTLYTADVSPIQVALGSERFLGKAQSVSKLPHSLPELFKNVHTCPWANGKTPWTIDPRSMSQRTISHEGAERWSEPPALEKKDTAVGL